MFKYGIFVFTVDGIQCARNLNEGQINRMKKIYNQLGIAFYQFEEKQ